MQCSKCGAESESLFCPQCGQPLKAVETFAEIKPQNYRRVSKGKRSSDLLTSDRPQRVRRGLNTMGIFAVLSAFFTLGMVVTSNSIWVFLLIVTCVLVIIAFAEAVVHYLGFYTIILALLICALGVYGYASNLYQ